MTGRELLRCLEDQRREGQYFIKWWRKDGGVADIELIDTFYDTAKVGDTFDGFELLDMEDMWVMVKHACADRVTRTVLNDNEVLIWERVDSAGDMRRVSSQFAPEFLMKVFVVENRGNNDEE